MGYLLWIKSDKLDLDMYWKEKKNIFPNLTQIAQIYIGFLFLVLMLKEALVIIKIF
jgi:hypothetical protein